MNTKKKILAFALAAGGAAAMQACSTPANWVEIPSRNVSNDEIYERCLLALELCDFTVEKSDRATGVIESKWDVHLAPFYRPRGQGGAGFRRRAIINIEEGGDAPPELNPRLIRVRVERERNREEKKPGDVAFAKWEPDSDDANVAREIAVRINERITPFQPSDDFYRRHGSAKGGAETAPAKPKNP
jgi:hypothetical protein